MAHDVFISHSSVNKTIANAICHALEKNDVRCWIAPRDIPAGTLYGEQITKGIRGCKVFLLIFSDEVNRSPAVQKELERAVLGYKKMVIPFRIEDVPMNDNIEFFLGDVHWINAYPDDTVFTDLIMAVKNTLGMGSTSSSVPEPTEPIVPPIVEESKPIVTQASTTVSNQNDTVGDTSCGQNSNIKKAVLAQDDTMATSQTTVIPKQMSMTMASFENLRMAGSGTVTIDWNDGSKIETHTLQCEDKNDWDFCDRYTHKYTGATLCTITITGENVTYLSCYSNRLTSLDVSKNTALRGLECSENQLTSLDVSKNVKLTALWCSGNQLTNLDMSKNAALKSLFCYNNRLTSLDVNKNAALGGLDCSENQLTSLDMSKNTTLTYLRCRDNQLTSFALNALFGTLNNNAEDKFIYIEGNPGTEACTRSIAEKKGWTFLEER